MSEVCASCYVGLALGFPTSYSKLRAAPAHPYNKTLDRRLSSATMIAHQIHPSRFMHNIKRICVEIACSSAHLNDFMQLLGGN